MPKSDEQLMQAYQHGDEMAFEELYERYSKRVYGYLNKRLSNRELANEVFQRVFLKLHKSREQYRAEFKFAPWLFTICRSVVIDSARKKAIYQDSKFEEFDEQKAKSEEVAERVEAPNLEGLSAEQQAVIEMRYYQEMDFDEMAKQLNVSNQTVRKRVSRALNNLRKLVSREKI